MAFACVLTELLEICTDKRKDKGKDKRKGNRNDWMSPFQFMVRFWVALIAM